VEKKLGIYICTGCSIGDALDIEKLTALAGTQGAAVVKTHEFLCGDEGAKVIENDISGEGINTVVIAACSQRVNFDVFNFPDTIIERVNLREHVVWSHTPNDEDTQMLAEDYLRMGAAYRRGYLEDSVGHWRRYLRPDSRARGCKDRLRRGLGREGSRARRFYEQDA